MKIIIPDHEKHTPPVPSIAVLRPYYANQNQLLIDELAEGVDEEYDINFTITSHNIWETRRFVQHSDSIHELIADTAESISPDITVTQYQLRHRQNRDCYTHDLEVAERKGALAANIITVQDINLGKAKYFRTFMRYAICQRLIILFSERSRLDDYIEDLGLTHESVDENRQGMTMNAQRKIQLVPQFDESAIENAVTTSLKQILN
ncbi:hypothetical protein COU75_01845 [Candidatus Peregrinibacteria bacterium CG10_big_fil_rev_8_21_14_0_10_42_8]|nr:MAG: hypothetical protein COU75_01845 [Candidatus Peregrinibacteria bacterium CG10_big_fil_rev_8_21_14_0_10_42_8]